MAGDSKTEKATPKRRQDERKKGNVFLSKDIIIVVSLLGCFYILDMIAADMYMDFKEYFLRIFYYAGTVTDISDGFTMEIVIDFVIVMVKIAMPLLLASVVFAIVATVAQTKLLFVTDSLKPKFSRLNPLEGIKKIISLKSIIDILKGIAKISVLLYILYTFIRDKITLFSKTLYVNLETSALALMDSVIQLVFQISLAFIVISAFDFIYQKWDYEKQIKMSKHDIKEEYKQMEGDPLIKGKIKENQRKMAMSRMMQAVPTADVVVKNPTHFAVALKYDIDMDQAPIVIAKGQDEVALRIIKVAEDSGVYVVENKPLARAIYDMSELNGEIPMEFYSTIADILVYVYRLKNKDVI